MIEIRAAARRRPRHDIEGKRIDNLPGAIRARLRDEPMPVRSQTCRLDEPTLELSFKLSKYHEPRTLGEKIRYNRRVLNLQQKELARILGVNRSTVTNWEKGYTKPRSDLYERLVQYLIS
jgi:DNA-binding transcriptional regulator YiaG